MPPGWEIMPTGWEIMPPGWEIMPRPPSRDLPAGFNWFSQCCGSGMFIPDPDPWFLPIPDPGVKKAPDPDPQICFLYGSWGTGRPFNYRFGSCLDIFVAVEKNILSKGGSVANNQTLTNFWFSNMCKTWSGSRPGSGSASEWKVGAGSTFHNTCYGSVADPEPDP